MKCSTQPKAPSFHDLMNFRVREILLVSTAYDGFVLEEDGHLSERIYNEYYDLNIYFVPRIHNVLCASDAFEALKSRNYDLIITMSHIADMSLFDFGKKVRASYPDIPIVMLSYERLSQNLICNVRDNTCIDRVFHWSGDSKILLAIIKYIEDKKNIEKDCKQGVQIILLVEDSPVYYSQFLSIIYTEIMKQTRYLVCHAENSAHKLMRVRARPKIVLAETYEEALSVVKKHKDNLLGIITDARFPKDGKINALAGFKLYDVVNAMIPQLPFLIQSEEDENAKLAKEANINFLDKNSPNLLYDIKKSILNRYGFGDFVFRYPNGEIIATASTIEEFVERISKIPEESLCYHGSHNHFSLWFRARTAFEIADELRSINIENYTDLSDLRNLILSKIDAYLKRYRSGKILDFDSIKIDNKNAFIKLGTGSLGGKARSIAFLNSLKDEKQLTYKYTNVKILTPLTFVVCSDVFEDFIEQNNLYDFAVSSTDEEAITTKFLQAQLPDKIKEDLKKLIQMVKCPLAIRSSSILEDSQILPFAGIYSTYIIPNDHPDPIVRYNQLYDSVRLVYSSAYNNSAKQYAKNANIRVEEEKMAVIIQELVGEKYDNYFYPVVSGVAQSYNFYPYSDMNPSDGTVSLALGFGKTIAEGKKVYRYCPSYPKKPPPYSGPKDFLNKLQSEFYALNLQKTNPLECALNASKCIEEKTNYTLIPLSIAHSNGTLQHVGSSYSIENDRIIDNIITKGPKLVTFAPIIKHSSIPLNEILIDIMKLGKQAFGCDVEIEFALNFPKDETLPKEFYFLQIRPMVVGKESSQTKIDINETDNIFSLSSHTIGNGVYEDIYDIIFVDPHLFKIERTIEIAKEIEQLNKILYDENKKCILIGFGRLGTFDRWLGIPLTWSQMSQARVVIEHERKNLQTEPSLGSHFYHNLTSLNMGYLHISNKKNTNDYVNWNLLLKQPIVKQTKHVKLVRSEQPFLVKIDGTTSNGIIYKPK